MQKIAATILSCVLASAAIAAAEPAYRSDLEAPLGNLICMDPTRKPLTKQLWQVGIFDAELSVEVLSGKQDEASQRAAAKQMALQRGHHGFVVGSCPGKSLIWRASTAASVALSPQPALLPLPLAAMQPLCRRIVIEFASHNLEAPRSLHSIDTRSSGALGELHRRYLRHGTISLSCDLDRTSPGRTPQLWYLIPEPPLPGNLLPVTEGLTEPQLDQALLTWFNAVRLSQNLAPLGAAQTWYRHAQQGLVPSASLPQQETLGRINQRARREQQRVLTHIQVSGQNRQELFWLLWHVAPHRRQILHPRATHLSVVTAADQYSLTASLLLIEARQGGR